MVQRMISIGSLRILKRCETMGSGDSIGSSAFWGWREARPAESVSQVSTPASSLRSLAPLTGEGEKFRDNAKDATQIPYPL